MILAVKNGLRIGYHTYPEIVLGDFVRELTIALAEANFTAPPRSESFENRRPKLLAEAALETFNSKQEEELTFDSFFRRIAGYINESMVLMADTSVCLFASADLLIRRRSGYIAQAVWLSIGFTTGGTVGASFAHSEGPVVTFVGDGGFQMIPQMCRRSLATNVLRLFFCLIIRFTDLSNSLSIASISRTRPPSRRFLMTCQTGNIIIWRTDLGSRPSCACEQTTT